MDRERDLFGEKRIDKIADRIYFGEIGRISIGYFFIQLLNCLYIFLKREREREIGRDSMKVFIEKISL